jgi:hypothetical protein
MCSFSSFHKALPPAEQMARTRIGNGLAPQTCQQPRITEELWLSTTFAFMAIQQETELRKPMETQSYEHCKIHIPPWVMGLITWTCTLSRARLDNRLSLVSYSQHEQFWLLEINLDPVLFQQFFPSMMLSFTLSDFIIYVNSISNT